MQDPQPLSFRKLRTSRNGSVCFPEYQKYLLLSATVTETKSTLSNIEDAWLCSIFETGVDAIGDDERKSNPVEPPL